MNIEKTIKENRELKFYIMFGIFMATITFVNLVSSKIIDIYGFIMPAGAIFYAITFPCTDIICECWGKERARKTVMVGFLANLLILLFIWIAVKLPSADFWAVNQESFSMFFGMVPRIILGSMVAYLCSQLFDVWMFSLIRKKSEGKYLWLRNNVATMASQLIDTILFITIAFYVTVPNSVLVAMIFGQYVVKLVIAVIDTPFVYLATSWIGVPKELEKGTK
ncbi:queuosine precursor transporter [Candidatus Peregrinibacteria bacterium]|nr:queuosine precursor transporter [Candidatus Peregrinibacteria bacterium]